MAILLWIGLAVATLFWLGAFTGVLRLFKDAPQLSAQTPPDPEAWPKLSVVIPLRDEAARVEQAARSLLEQDYPELELIWVDDRSEDGTGEILDRVAADDERARVVHLTELPEGWLGKLNAMQRGVEQATGEWLLFVDGDVSLGPGCLRRAVAYCLQRSLDHLALLPEMQPGGLFVDAVASSYLRQFVTLLAAPGRATNPKSRGFFGAGAFNLVRREALERSRGLEWLRMEAGDDMGLGMILKDSGARPGVLSAHGQVSLRWYAGLGEWMRASEKSVAVAGGGRVGPLIVSIPIFTALELAPLLTPLPLLLGNTGAAGWFGLAVPGLWILTSLAMSAWHRRGLHLSLLSPLASVIAMLAGYRACVLAMKRGGVQWRDTFYSLEAIRAGRRLPPGNATPRDQPPSQK